MFKKSLASMVVTATFACVPVAAQSRPGPLPSPPRSVIPQRVFVSVGGVFQITSNDFVDSGIIRKNVENGRFETGYSVGSGPAFDVSVGARVWRNMAVGAGVTRLSRSTATSIDASLPHPFFFNQPRPVSGAFSGTRSELAVHAQVRGLFPVNGRVLITVFGGPSFFHIEQSVVSDVEYSEAYPYDSATFTRAIADTQSESDVGYSVGGEFAFFFSRQIGVGVTAQYAGATAQMTLPSGTGDVKAGGGQIGGGLRLRF